MKNFVKIAATSIALASVTGIVFAQDAAPPAKKPMVASIKPLVAPTKKPLPSAATILDKYIEVTGGKAAYAKIKSTTMTGTISITAQGLKGTVEVQAKAPNKFYTAQTFDQIGKTEVGFDGKIGWQKSPFQGLQETKGMEFAQLREQSLFNSPLYWRQQYAKVEVIGVRQVEGKDAYVVRLIPKNGKPTIQYYDTETFYIVRSDTIQESPQGSIPVESYLSDYRAVDGVKTAFHVRSRLAATEIVTDITELKNNVPVADSIFLKPKP